MGLAHLMVTSDKGVGALRFLVFRVSRTCAGLASVSVYVYVERGIVVHLMYVWIVLLCHLVVYLWLMRCVAWVQIRRCRVGEGMD